MPERRKEERAESSDRRSFPRPPLWLNLVLLVIAGATFGWAKYQRDDIREKSAILFKPGPNNPAELNRVRAELSQMELTREQLARELDGRQQLLKSVRSEQFYIAIDTSKKKLYLRLGSDVVREANVEPGAPRTIRTPEGKTFTFVPVKGAFNVVGKQSDYDWRVPAWVYAMNNQPARSEVVRDGLGKYVVVLPDNYLIHSPPPENSPLHGMPKPGSIMVPEQDLAAIWPRITNETRVYIF
jgi:hypothetical protein